MNRNIVNKKLLPKKAIIIYDDKNRENSYSTPQYYLESRDIISNNGTFMFGAPVPMANDVMKDIAKAYMKSNSFEMNFGPLIAEHILYGSNTAGKTVVMWYRPATRKILNFASALQIPSTNRPLHIPATLYVVINAKLFVFALQSSVRPDRSTKIFNAPFFNIYKDGNVCLGSANVGKVRAKTFDLEADRFERAFYMAEQNNDLASGRCKVPLTKLWKSQLKGSRGFPAKTTLLPHPNFKTVEDIIQKLIGKN